MTRKKWKIWKHKTKTCKL